MNEDIERVETESFEADVIAPPGVSPKELTAATGVMIPCPGDEQASCDSAELLTEDDAGWVEEYFDAVAEAERTSGQENNLGCALAWLGDWAGAKRAFARGAATKNGTGEDRRRAKDNEAIADKALD